MSKRSKALERVKVSCKEHIGHTILVGWKDKTPHVLKDVSIVNDTVMLKVDNEPFPTIYFDSVCRCSCALKP